MGLAAFNQMRRRLAAEQEASQEPDPQPAAAAKGGDPVSTQVQAPVVTAPPTPLESAPPVPPLDMAGPANLWTLKQAPSEYLERYPEGKHAELARRVLGRL